jgi:molybdenum cofactor cytidylyltransferase
VQPADQPLVAPATVRAVAAALAQGHGVVIPCHGGHGGHPLALAADLFELVARLDPAVGLRQLSQRVPERVWRLAVDDPGVLIDIDSPEDYGRYAPPAEPRRLVTGTSDSA